jgi:hypothetical protein
MTIPQKIYLSTLSDDGTKWNDYQCQVVNYFAHDYRKYILTIKDMASDTEIKVFWPASIDYQKRFVFDPYKPALQTWRASLLETLKECDALIKPAKTTEPRSPYINGLE